MPAISTGRTFFKGSLLALLGSVLLLRCDFFDIIPPEVSIVSPTVGQAHFGTFPLEIIATDNRSVDRVEIFLDGNSVHEFTKSPYKADIDFDQIGASSATLKAVAYDQADNSAEATVEVSLSLGLKLTSPNGGEIWAEQSNQTITWGRSGKVGITVELLYSLSGGNDWIMIDNSAENDGQFNWILPNLPENASSCLVRINSVTTSFGDTSDEVFVITGESIPDLIVSSLLITSFLPPTIKYSYTITNIGSEPAILEGQTSVEVDNVAVNALLSADMIFNNSGDIEAGGSVLDLSPLDRLEPGASVSNSGIVTASFDAALTPYLILMVDQADIVFEDDETNNSLAIVVLPDPTLVFTGTETWVGNGNEFTRYLFAVDNRAVFPDELFSRAPSLPPCGANNNASRTWVDIYDGNGIRVYGFCNFSTFESLGSISFSLPKGEAPPASVYITLTDRLLSVIYTSNIVNI